MNSRRSLWTGTHSLVMNNDLSELETTWSPIVLGAGTSHSLVMAAPESVVDLGTDNRIVGKRK